MCGEKFLNGRFECSGIKTENYKCRKCEDNYYNEYYFICRKCESVYCPKCINSKNRITNYYCPMCGEEFLDGRFESSGLKMDNYKCRKCNENFYNEYYFVCRNCDSVYCQRCSK